MNREMIFGRLIAIATVLGERVFRRNDPSIASEFLDKLKRNPAKYITIIHEKLFNYTHNFKEEELALLDMFGELMAQLDIEDFNNKPLDNNYLAYYYGQKETLSIVGYKEAYELMGWDYNTNRSMLNTYLKRAEEKGWPEDMAPKPVYVLASGPLWYKYQIEKFRDSRK
ncbi:hypothetical protein BBD42_30935 [Paenibacillus sp. BIHB 4019]|uniref:Uncharacterized protein n=1 Tax=Paenibacillus sp. BIHB 4019 TaxID=1870819 RepID=A0A1B2DRV2_9BACL|nr:type I-C CRISPR-associated protein Cas8c/Csd1 [Paenibacillus sp. BIHB 4019]ANY70420.1 hypothetical protein BBD42_30935 [Paenibacillus sp. BIHB 4019]